MKPKSLFTFLVLSSLCLGLVAGHLQAQALQENWAERFPSKLTPRLEQDLARLPAGGTLDVYVVMKDRIAARELQQAVRDVPASSRHKAVSRILRSFSESSQMGLRALLARRGTAAPRILWLGNALRFTATAGDIEAVRGLEEVGYIGVVRRFPAETHQDAFYGSDGAPVPYYDGFETGSFGPEWTTSATGAGRIQITTANGPIGTYHVTMDSTTSGTYGTCSMTLSVDLAGVSNAYLEFLFKEFGDELDPEDNVSISADGINFYSVLSLSGSNIYEQKTVDLDAAAATHGISFNSDFLIRFQWTDNYPIPTDGFAFDEIRVELGDPPPPPPTPNIVGLQAPDCWAIGVDGDGALILNIDSGVELTHPDLANQIWQNPGEVPYGINGVDDDGNGYVDDFNGWDFEYNDNNPNPDSSSHGTNTAGIVCGDGTGGTKTGMAPDAAMAVAKIGTEADAWEAYQYAVTIGARVITSSYSWKWGIHDPDYHMFRTFSEAELVGGVIHANSIGNQGDQTSSYPIPFNISTPGNCPGPWIHPDQVDGGVASVLGCAGVNLDESLYTPSGQGPSAWEDVTIYDPAYPYVQNPDYWDYPYGGFGGGLPGLLKPDVCTYTGVVTTTTGGGYTSSFGGTSAATPHLGGAMCLLVSGNGHASPRKISQALQEKAEDKGPAGKDLRYGAGKVQVYDALLRLLCSVEASNIEPSIGETIQVLASGIPGEQYAVVWSASTGSTFIPGVGTFNLASPLNVLAKGVIPAGGLKSISVTIPNNPNHIGKDFFLQAAMDDQAGATGQILFSLVEEIVLQP